MRLKQLLFIALCAYWALMTKVCVEFDVSRFVDNESIIYLLFLSFTLVIFVNSATRITLPLYFILADYAFMKYLLGALKLGLLSKYGPTVWMFDSYSWAGAAEVNVWLRHGLLSTILLSLGIYLVDNAIGYKLIRTLAPNAEAPKHSSFTDLLFVLAAIFAYSAALFFKTGFGALSGVATDAIDNLYGVVSIESVQIASIAVLVFHWPALSRQHRAMFMFLLLLYMGFRIFTGSRSFIMYTLLYCVIFSSYQFGNFFVSRKLLVAVISLISVNIIFYPVALEFKRAISGAHGDANLFSAESILANTSSVDYSRQFFQNPEGSIEILDRLSDMGAPLRIINDTNVIPLDENFTFSKIVKRTINDMVPGDVFYDVVGSQQVWHNTYFGVDAVYGGEEFGLYGIYYIYFGYIGSLIALLFTGLLGSILWVKALDLKLPYRPLLLSYAMICVYGFVHNPMFEIWFVSFVFKPTLTLLMVYCAGSISRELRRFVKSALSTYNQSKSKHPL